LRPSEFLDNRQTRLAWLSALPTGRLYLPPIPGDNDATHLCYRLSRPQGHSAAGRIRLMKTPNDPIGNRNCEVPSCSAVPQPPAPPPAPSEYLEEFQVSGLQTISPITKNTNTHTADSRKRQSEKFYLSLSTALKNLPQYLIILPTLS
jgi:hypothetical protein